MKTLYLLAVEHITSWIEAVTGKPVKLRLSKKAMIASSDFLMDDPELTASKLMSARTGCLFNGSPLIRSIREENGWLLIDLNKSFFDDYAILLPDHFDYGNDYIDKRMEMFLRYGDCPLPDIDAILRTVLCASCASTKGKWTADDERSVLSMTHFLSGMERVRTEHSLARAAKIILYERRSLA